MKLLAFAIPAILAAMPAMAESHKGVELGVLTCSLDSSSNAIVYSDAEYSCELQSANTPEVNGLYKAKITRLGVDLEWTAQEKLLWTVISLTGNTQSGPIEGDYVGAGADAALGLGVGANVLVGGLDKSFALQPVSLAGQEGLGISAGVEGLSLHYEGKINK